MIRVRSYIFTERERRIIKRILEGEKLAELAKIMYRVRTFKDLQDDVELYLGLREKYAQG